MASERLHVPAVQLRVENGVVFDPGRALQARHLRGTHRGQTHRAARDGAKPKSGKRRVEGQSPQRKDAIVKVTGQAKYAADALPPGLLYARLVRPPVLGAKLKSVDTSEAESCPACASPATVTSSPCSTRARTEPMRPWGQ